MRSSLSVLGVPSTLLSAQHRIDGEMRAGWDAVNTHLPSPGTTVFSGHQFSALQAHLSPFIIKPETQNYRQDKTGTDEGCTTPVRWSRLRDNMIHSNVDLKFLFRH